MDDLIYRAMPIIMDRHKAPRAPYSMRLWFATGSPSVRGLSGPTNAAVVALSRSPEDSFFASSAGPWWSYPDMRTVAVW